MPVFSPLSRERLDSCHPLLQEVFLRVVEDWDCTVLEGHRGRIAQEAAFASGASKKHWPDGKHNTIPSYAADAAPYPVDWKNIQRFHVFAGYVLGRASGMGIRLRWGGDWDGRWDLNARGELNDLVHFELIL